MENGKVIQELDVVDVVNFIGKKNKTFQAIFLTDLEEVVGKDTQTYVAIRKLFLDTLNNYTRSVLKLIFGTDFESGR
jgi:hypothetical protein